MCFFLFTNWFLFQAIFDVYKSCCWFKWKKKKKKYSDTFDLIILFLFWRPLKKNTKKRQINNLSQAILQKNKIIYKQNNHNYDAIILKYTIHILMFLFFVLIFMYTLYTFSIFVYLIIIVHRDKKIKRLKFVFYYLHYIFNTFTLQQQKKNKRNEKRNVYYV